MHESVVIAANGYIKKIGIKFLLVDIPAHYHFGHMKKKNSTLQAAWAVVTFGRMCTRDETKKKQFLSIANRPKKNPGFYHYHHQIGNVEIITITITHRPEFSLWIARFFSSTLCSNLIKLAFRWCCESLHFFYGFQLGFPYSPDWNFFLISQYMRIKKNQK